MGYTAVTADGFAGTRGCEDWRYVLGAIHAEFRAGSFGSAATLVSAVAEAAEEADHHPDVDLRYPDHVRITLATHDVGEVTNLDVELARTISAIAARLRATPRPASPQQVELAIDTMDADRIRPFWAAVLGYRVERDYLVDPLRMGPPMWFQQMDQPRTERNRFHVDVSVPHDVAEQRIADALAAGGTLVEDRFARSWWVLADDDGNEACVCTWQDR